MTQNIYRSPMQPGTVIKLMKNDQSGETQFQIIETTGYGSSCIVYSAIDLSTDNNRVRIKEYYPCNQSIGRNSDRSLLISDHVSFQQGINRFVEGYQQQIKIRNLDKITNTTSNIHGIYRANNTLYTVMTYNVGVSYDKTADKSLNYIFRIARAAAKVIKEYHAMGLLHLDIKPANIYVIPESPDVIMMFDCDSVVSKEELRSGKQPVISYSKNWAAPEQLQGNIRYISERTDLYAIGAMIFERIYHRPVQFSDQENNSRFYFDNANPLFQNINPKVFPVLEKLFHQTLNVFPLKRFASADNLIALLDELIKLSDKGCHYFIRNAIPFDNSFFGREDELQKINETINRKHILFLRGEGGIGKSGLALRYAALNKDYYENILFVSYEINFVSAFCNDTNIAINALYRGKNETDTQYFKRKLEIMKKLCNHQVLLIIDNFDTENDSLLDEIIKLDCDLLFTSRVDYSGRFPQLNILAMPYIQIRERFIQKGFLLDVENENALVRFYEMFSGNTLVMNLLLKNMEENHLSPSTMFNSLSNVSTDNLLNKEGLFQLYFKVIGYNRISKVQKMILLTLAKEPLIGVRADVLKDLCDQNDYGEFTALARRGFINYSNATGRYTMHSILRETVRQFQNDNGRNIMSLVSDAGNILEKLTPEQTLPLCKDIYERHKKIGFHPLYFCGTESFHEKIIKMKKHFLRLSENEFPLFCLDTSVMNSGKTGIVITNRGIHTLYLKLTHYHFFEYSDIRIIRKDKTNFMYSVLSLEMINRSGEKATIIEGEQSNEMLDFLTVFFETVTIAFSHLLTHNHTSAPEPYHSQKYYKLKFFSKTSYLSTAQCIQLIKLIEDAKSQKELFEYWYLTPGEKRFASRISRFQLAQYENPIVIISVKYGARYQAFCLLTNLALHTKNGIIPYSQISDFVTQPFLHRYLSIEVCTNDGEITSFTTDKKRRTNELFRFLTLFFDALNNILSQ